MTVDVAFKERPGPYSRLHWQRVSGETEMIALQKALRNQKRRGHQDEYPWRLYGIIRVS